MPSPTTTSTVSAKPKCRIAEIVQYACDSEQDSQGRPQFHCWPIPRIFRICPGRPAVEITRYVDTDSDTGMTRLSPEAGQVLPKGKPWRDIYTYDPDRLHDN